MRLTQIAFHNYRLPLTNPLTVRGRTIEAREGVLIETMFDHAHAGWGDVAPLPGFSREDLDTAMDDAPRAERTWQSGEWPETADPATFPEDAFDGMAPSLRCGMEGAWLWALAAKAGRPLAEILGGALPAAVGVNGLLAGSREDILRGAETLRQEGYRAVKLKVGRRSVDEDAALAREVKQALGPSVALRLDANRAWRKDQAVAFAAALRGVEIEYVEEPLASPAQLPALLAQTDLPIALDETLEDTPASVWSAWPGIKAVVLKPTILGGFLRALRLGRRATAAGAKAVVSSSFESGVGLTALIQLAAALGGEHTPAGLDTYRWIHEDLLQPRLPLPAPTIDPAAATPVGRTLQAALLTPRRLSYGRRPMSSA